MKVFEINTGRLSTARTQRGDRHRHQPRRPGGQRRADLHVRRAAAAPRAAGTSSSRSSRSRACTSIDFIGNGKSSRALIRKGRLGSSCRTGTAGQVFTRRSTKSEQAGARTRRCGSAGTEYQADKDGAIAVPFSNAAGPPADRAQPRRLLARSTIHRAPGRELPPSPPASTSIAKSCSRAARRRVVDPPGPAR